MAIRTHPGVELLGAAAPFADVLERDAPDRRGAAFDAMAASAIYAARGAFALHILAVHRRS